MKWCVRALAGLGVAGGSAIAAQAVTVSAPIVDVDLLGSSRDSDGTTLYSSSWHKMTQFTGSSDPANHYAVVGGQAVRTYVYVGPAWGEVHVLFDIGDLEGVVTGATLTTRIATPANTASALHNVFGYQAANDNLDADDAGQGAVASGTIASNPSNGVEHYFVAQTDVTSLVQANATGVIGVRYRRSGRGSDAIGVLPSSDPSAVAPFDPETGFFDFSGTSMPTLEIDLVAAPVPASAVLLGSLIGLAGYAGRRKRRRAAAWPVQAAVP